MREFHKPMSPAIGVEQQCSRSILSSNVIRQQEENHVWGFNIRGF